MSNGGVPVFTPSGGGLIQFTQEALKPKLTILTEQQALEQAQSDVPPGPSLADMFSSLPTVSVTGGGAVASPTDASPAGTETMQAPAPVSPIVYLLILLAVGLGAYWWYVRRKR